MVLVAESLGMALEHLGRIPTLALGCVAEVGLCFDDFAQRESSELCCKFSL